MKYVWTRWNFRAGKIRSIFDTKEKAEMIEKTFLDNPHRLSISLGIREVSDQRAAKIKEENDRFISKYFQEAKST